MGDKYRLGAIITGVILFFIIWIYALSSWGLLFGLLFGWLPALIGAVVGGIIWPILVLILLLEILGDK